MLTVITDIAYFSYVPTLVAREDLLAADGRLEGSKSAANAVGSTAAGGVLQLLSAPVALTLDALSYLFSARMLSRISRREQPVHRVRGPLWTDLLAGLRFVAADRSLSAVALALGLSNMAWAGELALHVPYLADGLGLAPLLVGVAMAGVGPGAVLGSLLAPRLATRFGPLSTIAAGPALFGLATFVVPLVPARPAIAVPLLLLSGLLAEAGGQVSAITGRTIKLKLRDKGTYDRPNPVDRDKTGSKIHVLSDLVGLPWSVAGVRSRF